MKTVSLTLAAALAMASPSFAQDFYFGGGLAYGTGTSDQVTGGTGSSELSAGMVSLIVGLRRDVGNRFWGFEGSADLSFGAETENATTGIPCSTSASGSYLCSHDATMRFVGIYGATIATGTEVFGSLGVGSLKGDFATDFTTTESATIKGYSVGLGVNRAFGNGLVGRGEVIYDKFGDSGQSTFSSEYSGTSVRLSLLRRF